MCVSNNEIYEICGWWTFLHLHLYFTFLFDIYILHKYLFIVLYFSGFNPVVISDWLLRASNSWTLFSSDKQKDTNMNTKFGQINSSVPKWKLFDIIVREFCLFVEAGCEELVPLVDGSIYKFYIYIYNYIYILQWNLVSRTMLWPRRLSIGSGEFPPRISNLVEV